MHKLLALPRLLREREFRRFIVVGIANTAFSYLVYDALLFLGFDFALANLGALLLGIPFSFKTQGTLVFGNSSLRLVFKYAFFWLVIYLCNIGLIKLALSHGYNPYAAGAMVMPSLVVLSYALQKYWVFRSAELWVAAANDVERVGAPFSCLLCSGGAASDFIADCRDLYLGEPGTFTYVRCSVCGLVQQSPLPSNIDELYDEYPVHAEKSRLYALLQRALLSGVYLSPRNLASGTRVLDYGCGDGWYMQWCKERGIPIVGFEADHQHARSLTSRLQLPVYSDMQSLLANCPHQFDLITLHFVVEHLSDIQGTVAELSRLLRPGGTIRYVVPNIDSWEFRLFGRNWHGLDPPRHFSFPDARHAQKIAQGSGLEYVAEQNVSYPNGFAGSMPTWLTGHFRPWLFFLTMPFALILTRLFPSGNQAYVLRAPKDNQGD